MTFDETGFVAKLARQAWQTRCLARVRLKVSSWTVRTISRVHLTGCSERTYRTLVTFEKTGFVAKLARQAWQTRCLTRVRLKVSSWTVRTISRVHLTGCSERTYRTLVTFDETGHIAKLAWQAWQTRCLTRVRLKVSFRAIIAC